MGRAAPGSGRSPGLAVERAAVGERDRVVGRVDVVDRPLVATRAALGVAGVERGDSARSGVSGSARFGAAARKREAEGVEGRARSGRCRRSRRWSRSGRSRRTSRPARACRRGRRRAAARSCAARRPTRRRRPACSCRRGRWRDLEVGGSRRSRASRSRPRPRRAPAAAGSARPGRCRRRGRRTIASRSRIVGTASAAAARSVPRNGAQLGAPTGFEALTSGSRSSSAARRLTKVVFDSRRKSGSSEIASASRSLRSPIAFIIWFRFATRAEMSGRALGQRAGELRGVDDQVLERGLVRVQLAEDLPRGREERVQVLEGRGSPAGRRPS